MYNVWWLGQVGARGAELHAGADARASVAGLPARHARRVPGGHGRAQESQEYS